MKVMELMSRDPRTCGPDDRLDVPARIMWDQDCGCVPVVDGALRLQGMITDRDICMAAYLQGRLLEQMRVSEVMSAKVISIQPTDALEHAEGMMRREQVRRLPVVDPGGRVVGMLSLNDLAREASRERRLRNRQVTAEEVAITLGAVCAPRQRRDEGRPKPTPALPAVAAPACAGA